MKIEKEIQPFIISASRATDLPAFHCDWLKQSFQNGFCIWKNPFNGKLFRVSFAKARVFVFWTKNADPFLENFHHFHHLQYYFQYTLNDYEEENWEPGLPPLQKRIDTFIKLSEKIGKEKIIWRFDPLILSSKLPIEKLLEKVYFVGEKVHSFTEKLVFSFVDIESYGKVRRKAALYSLREFNEERMIQFAKMLQIFNSNWKLDLATCSEKIELTNFGIKKNRCIDARLMLKLFPDDKILSNYFGLSQNERTITDEKLKKMKDKGQRKDCGCIVSKDIGAYNSCSHGCVYCYACK